MEKQQLPKGFIIPEGWKVKSIQDANMKSESYFIVVEKKEPEYPTSWEELRIGVNAIDVADTNAIEVLSKLLLLRNEYRRIANGGKEWVPDWEDQGQIKFSVYLHGLEWEVYAFYINPEIFSFPTRKSTELFLENFRDNLLEEVKPLFIK